MLLKRVILPVLLLAIAGIFLWKYSQTPGDRNGVNPNLPTPGNITVTGKTACLKKKGPGPHTLECAIGLLGDNGNYYALKNLSQLDPEYKFSDTENRVEVAGNFEPEVKQGPDGNAYDIVGTIAVTSIRELE